MDFSSLLFSKLPVQCCAVGMVNTLKVAVCVTVAGRVLSATYPPTSVLTPHAVAMGPASWEPVSATQATKEKTVKKVTTSAKYSCYYHHPISAWQSDRILVRKCCRLSYSFKSPI